MVAARQTDTVETIRAALRCGKRGCACQHGPTVHCQTHPDGSPSLTVNAGTTQDVVVNCKAGCAQDAVFASIRALGLLPDEPLYTGPQTRTGTLLALPRVPSAVYQYRTPDGDLVAEKGRFELPGGKKEFKWRLPGGTWGAGLGGQIAMRDMPLWGAELVAATDPGQPVIFCEGEKAAQACRDAGLLAVTHGGGSSQKDFGESLNVLRGRTVILFADNDAPGRAYMTVVRPALSGIAASVDAVDPPLPEKGDAYEYFQGGGTPDALLAEHIALVTTAVSYLAHDAVRVRVPSALGVVRMDFLGLEKQGRTFECEVIVTVERDTREPFKQRINLLSSSARVELRRELDAIYGTAVRGQVSPWATVLNSAFNHASEAYLGQERAVLAADIQYSGGPPPQLVNNVIPADVPTILFGDGASLKTYLTLRMAIAIASGEPFFGHAVRQGPVLFIDYENTEIDFRARLNRLYLGLGEPAFPRHDIYYWDAKGIPLADQAENIARFIAQHGVVAVIVDSVVPALGGDPLDAQAAMRLFRGLKKLGVVTSLLIAHITKGGDTEKPFGSAFFSHEARMTWYVERAQDEESDCVQVAMFNRKANEGPKRKPLAFTVLFEGRDGPVRIETADVSDTPEFANKRSYTELIAGLLRHGPLTQEEIVAGLSATLGVSLDSEKGKKMAASVEPVLYRNKRLFTRLPGGRDEDGAKVPSRWALLPPKKD